VAPSLALGVGRGTVLLGALPQGAARSRYEGSFLMSALRFILGDQLSRSISSLRGLDPARDVVLMAEVAEETQTVPHHKQKIAFILSAMRHFADELRAGGIRVDYVRLGDRGNSGSFTGELRRAVRRHRPDTVVVTEPGEWRVREMMRAWEGEIGVPVEIPEDDRFLCSVAEFKRWSAGRKSLRMEHFYREMRRKTGWLMEGNEPAGGEWNFDAENRKPVPRGEPVVERIGYEPDDVTSEVLAMVGKRFAGNFGDLEPFRWAVTRSGARDALRRFVRLHLPSFGDYQDAMRDGDDFVHHALLSPYLNTGLLLPREVCEAALAAWKAGRVPLNAAEGFVRQILGWREFVRGVYWTRMPEYRLLNRLKASIPLPDFYWTGETQMHCVRRCVEATRRNAYAHHIQRLMVTGNFALLAGIDPDAVDAWYLSVYADAFEWVEMPNTRGMALHADGGLLASKPYAASGAYINRMSDYCRACSYDVEKKAGPEACPFNYLYWDFLLRNRSVLGRNPRLGMPYRTLGAMTPARTREIARDARAFFETLHRPTRSTTEGSAP